MSIVQLRDMIFICIMQIILVIAILFYRLAILPYGNVPFLDDFLRFCGFM